MQPISEIALGQIEIYSIIFLRVSGIIFTMPFFGSENVPRMVRIGLSLVLTMVIVPTLDVSGVVLPDNLPMYVVMLFKELLVGLILGFIAQLIFNGIQFAGDLVGFQMGLRIGNIIDPMSEEQVSEIGTLQNMLAVLIYLSLFWDHFLFKALAGSFHVIPIGGVHLEQPLALELVRMSAEVFIIALKLGAPLLAALFLADVAMGFIARTAPQINVFIIGFPVKVGVGMLLLGISLPFFVYVFTKLVQGMENNILIALRYL
ncbi:MAG: flagellar biosynthetic protein FliR [Candidatus Glassbacteria bacterium RIFCSPLOWO2_12_FULL_58_11]|uniref:Flagellar biosynthetic protein FliR n=2 Tax=Candidatus Glassiibacteriota TaxID=1817805 RepID=A0A1F5YKV2_9BACT|nr:MAG: flagellar biosynthetic protein FliR [Candidatus Glassbacteria bacterium GWA2_58_10]OGG00820.1 MAG: flagellar biosynthetic protein FliR [Candidatus Glassbacteria bacterium RIFCSPLOWO2_12_FULL_58_11]